MQCIGDEPMKPYYEDDLVTLYHGDCREVTEWVDAEVLVTDPPYGYNVKLNGSRRGDARGGFSPWANSTIANDHDLTARDEVLKLWGEFRPALVFGSWKMPKPNGTHTVLVWDKGPAVGMGDLSVPWRPNWEEVYVIGRGFSGHRGTSVLSGHMVVSWASKGREHPNMKPSSLLEALLVKCPAGQVADPFAGSGSTLVAAKHLGRRAIGVELEERYCEIAAKRLAQDTLFGGVA
jgi:site-specific DNA-methyltransferase (adenine-specific)